MGLLNSSKVPLVHPGIALLCFAALDLAKLRTLGRVLILSGQHGGWVRSWNRGSAFKGEVEVGGVSSEGESWLLIAMMREQKCSSLSG